MSHSLSSLLIGVDGGGTGCRVAVGSMEHGVMATAKGGRANFATDPDLALKNTLQTVSKAAAEAGLSESALETATGHIGLAGVMTENDRAQVAAALPYANIAVSDDRLTTITGVLGGDDGYVLSVGTGTIAASNKGGIFKHVGGWGLDISDQASGAWLGRAALEEALLSHEHLAQATEITRALLSKFQNDPKVLSSFATTAKPGDFGAFSPDVVNAARAGDQWAGSILEKGGAHLVRSLVALGFQAGDVLCLTGGLGPQYCDYLPVEFLQGRIEPRGDARDGAFYLAKQFAQKSIGALS